jgi:hypothetical protein
MPYQAQRIGGVGQHEHTGLGDEPAIGTEQLPAATGSTQRLHLQVAAELGGRAGLFEKEARQRGRLDPAATRIEPGRVLQWQAAARAGLGGVERLHIVRRQLQCRQLVAHGLHAEAARVQAQQALRTAARHAAVHGLLHRALRQQCGGTVETGMRAVLWVDDAVEQPGRVTRLHRAAARSMSVLRQPVRPMPRQWRNRPGQRRRSARGARRRGKAPPPPGREARVVHGHVRSPSPAPFEAGAGQRRPQYSQAWRHTHPGHRCGQSSQAFAQPQRRTLRVGRQRELVDQEVIDPGLQLGQQIDRLTHAQQQVNLCAAKAQPVQVACQRRPYRANSQQRSAMPRCARRRCRNRAAGRDRNEIQPRRARGVAASHCLACRNAWPRPNPACRTRAAALLRALVYLRAAHSGIRP